MRTGPLLAEVARCVLTGLWLKRCPVTRSATGRVVHLGGMTPEYGSSGHDPMDDAPLNSVAFVLSWYQQNVDARGKGARVEIG